MNYKKEQCYKCGKFVDLVVFMSPISLVFLECSNCNIVKYYCKDGIIRRFVQLEDGKGYWETIKITNCKECQFKFVCITK